MATCKWCGEHGPVNGHGYCEKCNETIREEIARNKTILQELAARSNPGLSDEEKARICADADAAYQALLLYKKKSVPFFKSAVEPLRDAVFSALGMEPPAPAGDGATPAPPGAAAAKMPAKKKMVIVVLCAALALVLVYVFVRTLNYSRVRAQENFIRDTVKAAVSERLKHPDTAKFSSLDYTCLEIEENEYRVSSTVQVQNDFGVFMEYKYTVWLMCDFEAKQYLVEKISLSDGVDSFEVINSAAFD